MSPCLRLSVCPCLLRLLVCAALLQTGCSRDKETATPPPRASVALRVLVVNEPGLVAAIHRLRGEWAERSGGELSATAATWAEVSKGKALDADIVVFPSRYLGEMCVRKWLRPVRSSLLESKNYDLADIFPLVRNELIKWGGQTMAVPLGVEPTSISSAALRGPPLSLLAQAAPRAVSNERPAVLFEESMKPRITEPVVVEALAHLVQAVEDEKTKEKVGTAGGKAQVPVLGYQDRLAAVTSASNNAASAFRFVEWLAQPDTSTQLARVGTGVFPVRQSLATSAAWYYPELTGSERSYLSKKLVAELNGQKCLLIPRIPGIDEYLDALADAVKAAVTKKVPPQEALQKAAERWEQITDAHGREAQQQAYLKHLGIQ